MIRSLSAAIVIATISFSTSAYGWGRLVHDPKNLAELVNIIATQKEQLIEAITANGILDDQTKKLIQQISELENIVSSLNDGFDLESLLAGLDLDSLLDELGIGNLEGQIASAKSGNWESVFGGSVGGKSAKEYAARIFSDAGLSQETVDSLTGSDDPQKKRIGNKAASGAFTSVAAEQAVQQTNASMERTSQLIAQIDDATNLKQAIDLNTRVTGELVIALLNQANMEAIQTVAISEAGVIDAATMASDEEFLTLNSEEN